MSASFAPVAQLYGLNTRLYEQALEGLDRESALRQLAPHTNPILWIAGHLASTRFGLATMLGEERPLPWSKVFHRGAALEDLAGLPDLAVVHQGWREISDVLMPRLSSLTDDELAATSPRTFPIGDRTIRGAITFFTFHEGYHLGQMGYIRKCLGFPGLLG
jgi:hypothetical protein